MEITPNGAFAVVKANNASPLGPLAQTITIWDPHTGNQIGTTGCSNAFNRGAVNPASASDAIAMTNYVAVVAGGRPTATNGPEAITHVDVIRLGAPTSTCLANYQFGSPGASTSAGLVSDVEITPDGHFAVVNHQNWIHVLDLSAGGSMALAFNTGNAAGGGPKFPGPQSDSIAVTNTRAVVLQTLNTATPAGVMIPHTWAYVIDLAAAGTPTVVGFDLMANADEYEQPHDVAITPDGTLAFVAMNHATALLDISGAVPALVSLDMDGTNGRRLYDLNASPVDSVELTNERAVVLGSDILQTWVTRVHEIRDPSGPVFNPLWSYVGSLLGAAVTDEPHDLEIWEDAFASFAVVKTSGSDIVIDDLAAPTASSFHRNLNGAPPRNSSLLVSFSDSVAIGAPYRDAQGVGHQIATTIGNQLVGNRWEARVAPIDLRTSPPTFLAQLSVSDPVFDVAPADLDAGRTGRDVLVRCYAPPDEQTTQAIEGRDFLRYGLEPVSELARFGGKGERIWAMDSLRFDHSNAVSISERLSPDQTNALGHVHFVRVQ